MDYFRIEFFNNYNLKNFIIKEYTYNFKCLKVSYLSYF